MMPVGNLNMATSLEKDTKGVVQDQTIEHVYNYTGVHGKLRGDDMSDHDENYMIMRDG